VKLAHAAPVHAQIKELWQKMITLFGDEQTALQKQALEITPAQ
jgi:hypothetical protein